MIETSAIAEKYVLETFDVLLAALDIEDEGFAVLDDLLVRAEENK
jgi:hypothetical protein